MRASNEKPSVNEPRKPPPGYRPLAEVAAANGIGRRQLWLRVRADPASFKAVQTDGGRWYLPADTAVRRRRARITAELEARIRRAWLDTKPAVIAQREHVAVSTVYKIGNKYDAEIRAERLRREEELEQISDGPELVGMHLYGEPYPYIKAVDVEANREYLDQLPRLGEDCWFDPFRRGIYTSPARLQEIAAWEDERRRAREELHKGIPEEIRRHIGPG